MKLRAITPASVSLQLGPLIQPGHDVEFGDEAELPEALREEIDQNIKRGLVAIVKEPIPTPEPPPGPQPEKKKGR